MEGKVIHASLLPEASIEIESSTCPETLTNPRKKKNKSRRRFSNEQIRSLESIFQSETKLQPRRKLQLARELGLQPRQVAIWFQNRRARWKSKEIEQSYMLLKANYDSLFYQFECVKKEKQSLLTQLQNLSDLLKKRYEQSSRSRSLCGNCGSRGSDSEDTKCDLRTKPSCLNEGSVQEVTCSDDDEERNSEFFQQGEAELLNMGDDGSLSLHAKWCNLDYNGVFDQSCGSSNWWDFWTYDSNANQRDQDQD